MMQVSNDPEKTMTKRVLIVGDDKDTLEELTYLSHKLKLQVFNSLGAIPVEEVRMLAPDVVLMDCYLFDASGADLCLKIKFSPFTRHIPVVMFSDKSGGERLAQKCRADAYLHKPFDLGDLLAQVNELVC
ncbi:MAG: response regulator [Bacteroidetes bacterium]|nr:response regulator [Bacteroidota bacterium]